jgi:hypothetical protein
MHVSLERGLQACGIAGALLLTSLTAHAADFTFQTINDPADNALQTPTFNQLLGVNNAGVVAGYFGDGAVVANNGFTWKQGGGFTPENVPGAAQTQVVAINNTLTGGVFGTAGFSVDNAGSNHGFTNSGGTFTTVDNPLTTATPGFNQILGLNDTNQAVGFYQDAAGTFHGYLYNSSTKTFTAVNPSFSGVSVGSVTATGINDLGVISGFYVDAAGNTHGFIDNGGVFTSLDDPNGNGTNTSFFGLNNTGQVVGSFTNANGSNGLVYNTVTNTWQTVDDPNQSFAAAFGTITGTTLNGINDAGDLVGFYADAQGNVDGLLAAPVPEPASLSFVVASALLIGLWRRQSRTGKEASRT